MSSYTRDLRKLIARTATLVEDRWNSFLGQIDLEKYYPVRNLGEVEFVEDLIKSNGPVRLPKLRSDQTLISNDHMSLSPPNEEETGQIRLLSLLSHHVNARSPNLTVFLTDASKWMQHLLDWFAAPNRFVAFAQFTLSPSTRNELVGQFTDFSRVLTLQLAQIIVVQNNLTEKVSLGRKRGKIPPTSAVRKIDSRNAEKSGDNNDYDDRKYDGDNSDDNDNDKDDDYEDMNYVAGNFASKEDMIENRSSGLGIKKCENGHIYEYEKNINSVKEEEKIQESACQEQNYWDGVREQMATRLMPFVLPEFVGETFRSTVEWDKQAVTGIRASYNLLNSMPYSLMHYVDTIASVDQMGLCKLFIAPIVKLLTRKQVHMYDPCVFSCLDSPKLTSKSLLYTFLTMRAYGLIQFFHRLVDFVKRSPELVNGPLRDLILTHSTDVFAFRNWSATNRVFCAINHGCLLTVQYLIRSGKLRHGVVVDADGRNVLIAAVSAGKADIVKYLITELNPPININAKCESGNTALHVAVSQNNLEIARMLLETGGATVDVVNMNGNGATPLHMAAMFGYTNMVDLLVDYSASLSARTTSTDSLTPVQLAQRGHHHDLTNRLEEMTVRQSQTPVSTNVLAVVSKTELFNRMRRSFEAASRNDRSNSVATKDQRPAGRGANRKGT